MSTHTKFVLIFIMISLFSAESWAQVKVKGQVIDETTGEALIGANISIDGTAEGTTTDFDGYFILESEKAPPFQIIVEYLGYESNTSIVEGSTNDLLIRMKESSVTVDVVEVKASRVSEETKKSPLTIESLDNLAIKEAASSDFYSGLGNLKGVDLTTASLGFQVINTRGFNSTSPVRSLQIIDGVDNQAPGLNFSLGNFLGSSELDVNKMEIIVGASSAFYGPNAFNGVVSMETKNPFFHRGLSASVKAGERNLAEGAVRWADAFKNKNGNQFFAYKLNLSYMRADDWVADNTNPVYETETGISNPGGYNKVNEYGDEYDPLFDASQSVPWSTFKGLGTYHRKGYAEKDLVDYNTKNLKSNLALHFRLNPKDEILSPEIIAGTNYSQGTTVYQGDNRFSLKNIQFFQHRVELRKKDKYFLRAYMTQDDAGDSYDPYFTALRLQQQSMSNEQYRNAYIKYWASVIEPRMIEGGYPKLEIVGGQASFDRDAAKAWMADNQSLLTEWHKETALEASKGDAEKQTEDFYEVGTERFNRLFKEITSTPNSEKGRGTKLVDRSKLYHVQGEYNFNPSFLDYWKVGGNYRLYTPDSEGTIFVDSTDVAKKDIRTGEYGIYTGIQKSLVDNKLKLSATFRMDKNQNFKHLFSPALSAVYNVDENDYIRLSFSSAIRNPTLSDQYLDFDVGPATLRGNLAGADSLITINSFQDYRNSLDRELLEYFDIDPIQPEQVQSAEVGYRTTLFNSVFLDASYFFSQYTNFIGYNIGIDATFSATGLPNSLDVYRYAANSKNVVQTQGFSAGVNYYFDNFRVSGNYSWNKLVKTDKDDPIIPAFNTPEHKFNVGFGGRNIKVFGNEGLGFNVNYKWLEGFLFEGSPQFTGFIESYGLLDAQVNYNLKKYNTTLKIGASNILDNKVYQTYGGPLVGRLAYIKMTYDFKLK